MGCEACAAPTSSQTATAAGYTSQAAAVIEARAAPMFRKGRVQLRVLVKAALQEPPRGMSCISSAFLAEGWTERSQGMRAEGKARSREPRCTRLGRRAPRRLGERAHLAIYAGGA
eukprot:CAMPEP_0195644936 /NCGR_PEP_ID=MMETSP0815-20121206/28666_1 /TAXON_ID=97485 /ORGANISM="Prymnesium parvum, Strain Texoma1" /LENGTH=114 /DNA_ID=CAMNT_0040788141 /DNA_START=340 /DNA_END=681 /DNA_ORIENTATION=-